jgi:hypothetical protein
VAYERVRIDGAEIDWWPIDELDERRANIERFGRARPFSTSWDERPGVRATVAMLWKLRDSPELVACTWLSAALWEWEKSLPWNWSGRPHAVLSGILIVTLDQLVSRGGWRWSAGTRYALPQLDPPFELGRPPRTTADVVRDVQARAVRTAREWRPVQIVRINPKY